MALTLFSDEPINYIQAAILAKKLQNKRAKTEEKMCSNIRLDRQLKTGCESKTQERRDYWESSAKKSRTVNWHQKGRFTLLHLVPQHQFLFLSQHWCPSTHTEHWFRGRNKWKIILLFCWKFSDALSHLKTRVPELVKYHQVRSRGDCSFKWQLPIALRICQKWPTFGFGRYMEKNKLFCLQY